MRINKELPFNSSCNIFFIVWSHYFITGQFSFESNFNRVQVYKYREMKSYADESNRCYLDANGFHQSVVSLTVHNLNKRVYNCFEIYTTQKG